MNENADCGDILSQKDFDISESDCAQTLYNKVINIALMQIEEFIPHLKNKSFKRIKQNHKIANTWRKREKTDGKIDFRMSSKAIYDLVRALSKPYPGAYILYKKKEVIVWQVKIVKNDQDNIECGKILASNKNSIVVKTFDAAIEILKHEFSQPPILGEYL